MQKLFDKIKDAGFEVRDGYVYFGEYPRTVKADGVALCDSTDARGYYLGSDGCYYAKGTAKPHNEGCKFSSGEAIVKGKDYYFKVEPIRWRVLDDSDGVALLLCDSIIDCKRFDEKTNVYANSELRAWLNGEFLKAAFGANESERIEAVTLDSGETDKPASTDGQDKVFLLSFSEVAEMMSGGNEAKTLKASDYGIAMGVMIRFAPAGLARYTDDNYADGTWWLRSPYTRVSTCTEYVDFLGNAGGADYVYYSRNGVVAALRIRV